MLTDATRIKLLGVLRDGEQTVGGLTRAVEGPQALVSQHLASCVWQGW